MPRKPPISGPASGSSRSASRRPTHLMAMLPIVASAAMATSAPASLPQVDFSKMGTVGFGGSFEGLDWWTSSSPFAASSSSSNSSSQASFSAAGDTVFYTAADGSAKPLGSTTAGGQIRALCWANTTDSSNGTLFIGGSFSSIGSTSAANVVSYSIGSSSFKAISSGVAGPVDALFCDNANGQVWVGGAFVSPSGGSGNNVALWSTSSSSWSPVPFTGLNGPVADIAPSANGSSVYFSGAFTTLFASNSSSNSTSSNSSSVMSMPSAARNTTTVGYSGYLTPVSFPATSVASGTPLTITAGPSTDQSQYSDPNVLLCPGSGTWLARDGSVSNVDILGYNYITARGVRMTNALIEGRGATSFCVTSLPDNTQLNMTYTDPKTGQNATCWEHCPLYTVSSIAAQDFLFTAGSRSLTGLQLELKTWIGDGAGLSSVQLLSDAVAGNTGVCGKADNSTVETSGQWTTKTVPTDIPATTSYYLMSSISSGTAPGDNTVTWYPYVSATGYYDVYLDIPGCTLTQDCDRRTSVDMTVFPQAGGLAWTSTISEQVQSDTRALVYSGLIEESSSQFTPTIKLALASSAQQVSGGQYSVVAQAVELFFFGTTQQANVGALPPSPGGGNVTITSSQMTNTSRSLAFGVYEWKRSSSGTVDASSTALANTTETALTTVGFGLDAAYNASNMPSTWSVNAVAATQSIIFVGGNFSASSNFTNIVSVNIVTGNIAPLSGRGLNGAVRTAAVVGDNLFVGGDFTATADNGTALPYVAKYDPSANAWSALGGGLDGPVTSIVASPSSSSQLLVTGNFSSVISSSGSSSRSGPYAIWDTSSSAWSTGSVFFGTVSSVATDSSSSGKTFLAGRVTGSTSNAAQGFAYLSTGDSGAQISSLAGVNFGTTGSGAAPAASSAAARRAVHSRRSHLSKAALVQRAVAPSMPAPSAAVAPAVLAGAFWTNASASGKPTVTVLGGNFTRANAISALGFYSNDALSGPTPPVRGVIRAVAVIGDMVYAGGSGVNVSSTTAIGSGMVTYNLATSTWKVGGIPSLSAPSGAPMRINAMRQREGTNTLVVAGNFAFAGSLGCPGVCLWDTQGNQWTTPGVGLGSGEVRAIDFADESHNTLLVAGSFTGSDGAVSYVASYSFANNTWSSLGGLPGPALAVTSNNKNASNLFAAGYSTTDGSAYLQQWDGQKWTAQNASLAPASMVSSLAFVPMTQEHTAAGAIQSDRMLMVSGDLYLQNSGNVTSALYDGANYYPYLVGTSVAGTAGAASQLFWSVSDFDFTVRRYLATGIIVLIAIAIATGLILLLVLLFLLISWCLRRRERKASGDASGGMYKQDPGSDVSSTHQHVLHNVQAALQNTLLGGAGAGSAAAMAAAGGARRSDDNDADSVLSDYSRQGPVVVGAAGTAGAAGAAAAGRRSDEYSDGESEEEGRETTMRYDFEGEELLPGEMSMKAGQRVVILDDVQSDEWWYARDPATGREGVVPATYVW